MIVILATVGLLWPSLLVLVSPMVFMYMIVWVGFFFESCYRSEKSRKNLLLAYILLIVLGRNIYYLLMIENDRLPTAICTIRGQDAGHGSECHTEATGLLLFDSVSGWLCEVYFAIVLFRYSQQPIED